MDTMHAAAPPRARWFAGLRRSRSRLLGGVAGGFAEFWAVDPLLVRVLAVSPLLAAVAAFVGQVVLGLYWTVPVTQLLWLIAAATIAAYLLGWMLIPQPDAASLARRFLGWGGPLGTLAKLTVGFVLLIGLGWLGLGTLGYVGALDDLSPLVYVTGMLVTVGGLATLGVWLARGGDLRDALHRLGSPGFGRIEPHPLPGSIRLLGIRIRHWSWTSTASRRSPCPSRARPLGSPPWCSTRWTGPGLRPLRPPMPGRPPPRPSGGPALRRAGPDEQNAGNATAGAGWSPRSP